MDFAIPRMLANDAGDPIAAPIPGVRAACPSCRQDGADQGSLPTRSGLMDRWGKARLYQCRSCGMLFKRPCPSQADLQAMYEQIPETTWQGGSPRRDFQLVARVVAKTFPRGAVLDVGCFCGDLLQSLPDRFEKFGIEPSAQARQVATERGIRILGADANCPLAAARKFEAILLIDVIEHLPDPLAILGTLSRSLAAGGRMIISTGNSDSLLWRLMRRDYYYYYPEHVSFLNARWFRWAAGRLDLTVSSIAWFRHERHGPVETAKNVLLMGLFAAGRVVRASPMLRAAIGGLYPLNKAVAWPRSPYNKCWPDHLMVVLKRPRSSSGDRSMVQESK